MNWIIAVAVLVVVGFILDREIYFYEGVRLGPRAQAWLYDRWSRKYDQSKHASQQRDGEMLAQPLLEKLKDTPESFILDFATGTGRLSFALMSQPEFEGRIIALDLSQGMLERAAAKLHAHLNRVDLLRHPSLPLPFPDAAFDVVCALEVLELFPNMDEPLAELTRVLRPGGVLLTSRGTEESGRKAKVKSATVFTTLLQNNGLENVQISKWWKLFDRVFAAKKGSSHTVSVHLLTDVLRCSSCHQTKWEKKADALYCLHCGNHLTLTKQGIVLN
jgi:ubiquinone/menaquinone biosynthesis C-methylase UbiE